MKISGDKLVLGVSVVTLAVVLFLAVTTKAHASLPYGPKALTSNGLLPEQHAKCLGALLTTKGNYYRLTMRHVQSLEVLGVYNFSEVLEISTDMQKALESTKHPTMSAIKYYNANCYNPALKSN
jgi:hypothetical protein